MASSNLPVPWPPSLEDLSNRGVTALLPWILRMTAATTPREVAVFINQPSRSITLLEGSLERESVLREINSNSGPFPATKASIESLPRVQIQESDLECAICLSKYRASSEDVKEMPCKHKFHSNCIDKWLGIQATCPICRFKMPIELQIREVEGDGWVIHVFYFGQRDSSENEVESLILESDPDDYMWR